MKNKKIKEKTKKTYNRGSNISKKKIEELKKEIKSITEEKNKLIDKNTRLLAEFDNFKRRTIDEKGSLLKYAGKDLAFSLLPIIDDLYRTINIKKINAKSLLEGIELIITKINKVLKEHGILSFDSEGQDFDPELHEALMSEKSKKGNNVIIKEFEKGYKMNDKILRHAKVVVGKD